MNIFQVISNISHNGERLTPGQIFEAELAEFEHLVKSGALKLIDGATNVAEATEKIDAEKQESAKQEEAPVPASQNTWGPKKAEPVIEKKETTENKIDESTQKDSESTQANEEKPANDENLENKAADITGDDL